MDTIGFSINGRSVSCRPGTSILQAASDNGIYIPTLCHHRHLKPVGACRICLVEEEQSGRVLASCVTPAAQDMSVLTETRTLRKYRTDIVRLMMANHPESCIVCNQGNRCQLRAVAARLDIGETGLYAMPQYAGLEEANPFIVRDLSKCILCGKCIRADHELVVVGAIDYNRRGFESRPAALHELPLEQSSCTFCGTCVSLCPTGALLPKTFEYVGTPSGETETVCGFCGVGCSLVMGFHDGRVVEVNPSHRGGTVNRSTLCIRGHFAHDYLHVSERLTDPMIRNGEGLVPVSWDEALEQIATKLSAIKETSGPNSLAFLGSSKCSNEENYLFQKMARVIFQTHNLDSGGYGYGNPVIESCREAYLRGKPDTTLSDLEKSEVIFVLGADIPHSSPVIGYALKRAYKERGTPIVLSDPRVTELIPFSALWLPVRPQSDMFLINALAALLHSRGAVDHDFIDRFTSGADPVLRGLESLDIQKVPALTGIPREQLERTADLIQGRKTTFIVGNGILQQGNGVQAMQALFNLILLTGNLGREGNGIIFLSEENNQAGAMDMGVTPDLLPGRIPIGHERGRKQWEDVWGVRLSPDPGLNVIRMVEEAEKGNLRGLYVMGENPLRSLPQPERVKKAFRNLSFLVVQDILETETTRMADVILPAAAFSEKAGSFTNFEGRIQHFRPVVPPPGSALPDWDILNRFYSRMCGSPAAGSLDAIRREITTAFPSADRSGGTGHRSWMGVLPPHKLFHPKAEGETIAFAPLTAPYDEPEEGDYAIRLIIISLRCHLGSGTRTSCSERIKVWSPENAVEMSTTDGRRFNLTTGEEARITSPVGSVIRTVRLRERITTGLAYIPKAVRDHDVMTLIPLRELGKTDSPGWKMCRVKIEKIGS